MNKSIQNYNRKNIFFIFLKIIGAGIIATIILSAFVLIYAYSGANVRNPSGATDYILGYKFRSNCKEGIAWNFIDESGFNNAYKSDKKSVDVLLMGSSNMNAMNVMPKESTAYRLNEKLSVDNMYLYNIGMDGHTISRCINNLKNAVSEYDTAKYVVMETGSVNLDKEEMMAVINGTLKPLDTYESKLMRKLQKVPCVKILYKRIQGSIDELKINNNETIETESEMDTFDEILTGEICEKSRRKSRWKKNDYYVSSHFKTRL